MLTKMSVISTSLMITNVNNKISNPLNTVLSSSSTDLPARQVAGLQEVATGQTGVCKVEPSSYTPFAACSVSSRTGSSSFTRLPSLCVILKTGAGDLELVLEGHRIAKRRLQPAWRGHNNMRLHKDGQQLEDHLNPCHHLRSHAIA